MDINQKFNFGCQDEFINLSPRSLTSQNFDPWYCSEITFKSRYPKLQKFKSDAFEENYIGEGSEVNEVHGMDLKKIYQTPNTKDMHSEVMGLREEENNLKNSSKAILKSVNEICILFYIVFFF